MSSERNTLYYGDNLAILREHIPAAGIDLIYLDPPFNSNRNYNVLFKDESGLEADAQIVAFEDTWHWDEAARMTYYELIHKSPSHVSKMIGSLKDFIGANQMMAYIVMMSARLLELHRVLKPTGSLYLHCDPTVSHYLKIVLDSIFGIENFGNEISWRRSNPKSHAKKIFPNCRDVILRYSKTEHCIFNRIFTEHDPGYVSKAYKYTDDKGSYRLLPLLNPSDDRPNLTYEFLGITRVWRWTKERMLKAYNEGLVVQLKPGAVPQYKLYLEDSEGRTITNDWHDLKPAAGNENMGYPTQKPLSLLERIILASSHEGDIVLDPFCGCGTAVAAAQKLNRKWIGIDITHLAIAIQKYRLKDMFGLNPKKDYDLVGEPKDLGSARQLAQDDRYQFQWWALSLVQAKPVGGEYGSKKGKKGKDRGVDGMITFIDDADEKPKTVIVQVKSGNVKSGDIRDLVGTVETQKSAMGVFITLEESTKDMRTAAADAGVYYSPGWEKAYPKIQIFTIEELMNSAIVNMPPIQATFKRAEKETGKDFDQLGL